MKSCVIYIIEILDVHPSADLCRVFNGNAVDNFQAYTKFSIDSMLTDES